MTKLSIQQFTWQYDVSWVEWHAGQLMIPPAARSAAIVGIHCGSMPREGSSALVMLGETSSQADVARHNPTCYKDPVEEAGTTAHDHMCMHAADRPRVVGHGSEWARGHTRASRARLECHVRCVYTYVPWPLPKQCQHTEVLVQPACVRWQVEPEYVCSLNTFDGVQSGNATCVLVVRVQSIVRLTDAAAGDAPGSR